MIGPGGLKASSPGGRGYGPSIDSINEYEPIEHGEREWAGLADSITERD